MKDKYTLALKIKWHWIKKSRCWMESFYLVMDLACWLKLRKLEKHFCSDVNVMDGKHNQQFWLRSTISQCNVWSLRVRSFLCSSGIGVCAAGKMRFPVCPVVTLPESWRCREAPGMYDRFLSLFCRLWKEGLVCMGVFFCMWWGHKPKAMTVEWTRGKQTERI